MMSQVTGFWNYCRDYELTLNEMGVFTCLLCYLNLNGRRQPFSCSNTQIMTFTGIPRGSLDKAKKGLLAKGLILNITPGRAKKAPTYELVDFENLPSGSHWSSHWGSHSSSHWSSHSGSHSSSHWSSTSKKNKVKEKDIVREGSIPESLKEVEEYCFTYALKTDPKRFYDYYEKKGWRTKSGQPIRDWKALCRSWSLRSDNASDEELEKLKKTNEEKELHKYDHLFNED